METDYSITPATVGERGGRAVEFYRDDRVVLYHGDVRETLRALPEESVQTVVTSPPY